MKIRSAAVASAFALILVSVPHAQDAQTPSFRAGVETLPLDVTVVDDKGQPIRDLLAADFTVRVDGRARRVASAQWVAAGTATRRSDAALPDGFVSNEFAAGGRLIVLVVDQPNIPFGEMRPIRDAIGAFIDRLSSSDRTAVVGLGQPAVTTAFIADKVQLKQAIERIPGQRQQAPGGSTHEIPVLAAIAIETGDEASLEHVAARDCPGRTQRERMACKDEIRAEASAIASEARQSGDAAMNGLKEVLASLKPVEGPKTVVFVSQGFFADRSRGDDTARINEIGSLASAARVNIYSLRMEPSSEMNRQKAGQPQLIFEEQMVRT